MPAFVQDDSIVHLPRKFARWRHLVTAEWLDAWLRGGEVEAPPGPDWRMLEIGFDARESFSEGHIPGAGYVDTTELEGGPFFNKVEDDALLDVLSQHGVHAGTTVILYGRNLLCAARAAHLMLYAGVGDVRILDGGFAGWLNGEFPLEQGEPSQPSPPSRPAASGEGFRFNRDYLVDIDHVRTLLQTGEGTLASIRSRAEFDGTTSGYGYMRRGDIPGAKWGRAGDVNCIRDYLRADGTLRPPDEIEAFWRESGIRAGDPVTFHCGTGWRASMAFFVAWLMGWPRISLYDGGWLEWSHRRGERSTTPAR